MSSAFDYEDHDLRLASDEYHDPGTVRRWQQADTRADCWDAEAMSDTYEASVSQIILSEADSAVRWARP